MRKIIIAPDSFKGTMDAITICRIMAQEAKSAFPDCKIVSIPVADGGEGTVDCFLQAVPGEKVKVNVIGPFFEEIPSFYGLIRDGEVAVVEMAAAAGLTLAEGRRDPAETTTYGVGQLIRHAIEHGAKEVIVGLGGSCTNDGGCGMAAALGVRFYDREGKNFIPTGSTLCRIDRIDLSEAKTLLEKVKLSAMCDVDNPLYGPQGAAYIFAPQKGADEAMVCMLDDGLRHYGAVLEKIPGKEEVCALSGGGAAGGFGAGIYALCDAPLLPGIHVVLDTVGFDGMLEDCDLILTGEGRIDTQSLRGKVVMGISRRAKHHQVPVCAVVGDALDIGLEPAYQEGLSAVITINRRAIPLSEAKMHAEEDLRATVKNVLSLLKSSENRQKSL